MGRPVKVRATYVGERARLTRLEEAVFADPRLPGARKDELVGRLRELVRLLVGADEHVAKGAKK
jgi:hypothetical protein